MTRHNPFAWNRGRHLALKMLEESAGRPRQFAMGDSRPDGKPGSNPVLEYVEKAIDSGDRTVLRAFCAVLSDHVAASGKESPATSSAQGGSRS